MCGIAGWFGSAPLGAVHAEEMARRLRHRGPDAKGIRSWDAATLVHTRLSIIDLTPTGDQPLSDEDGRIWTVFNGEIYNHRELRHQLESRGHVFRGRSDTEVLPHLYQESPADLPGKLRGMFAFALYDSADRRLLLSRDRFGIKPLFYAVFREGIAFASEVRALLCLPGVTSAWTSRPLRLHRSHLRPGSADLLQGIRALEPGTSLEATILGGGFRYRLKPISLLGGAAGSLAVAVLGGRASRPSHVDCGACTARERRARRLPAQRRDRLVPRERGGAGRPGTRKLRTFNVRFPDAEYDETWAACMVAKAIGTEHETLEFQAASGTWDEVCGLLAHTGQPFADTSVFAVNAVARLMRQRVKVALSGDGGDGSVRRV